MKRLILDTIRKLVPPSMRFELSEAAEWIKELRGRACLWRWEIVILPSRVDSPYHIIYLGRKFWLDFAMDLLMVNKAFGAKPVGAAKLTQRAIVCEIPLPGALCVPWYLSSIVPLGRSIEAITADYGKSVRQFLHRHQAGYCRKQALSDAEIDRVDKELLRPYASARHDTSAHQFPPDSVRRLAQNIGRLDLLLLGDEVLGCKLGKEVIRDGKRYWNSIRAGYPEAVFSDPKRLRETNSINNHLALEWANENGFDYFDFGVSKAHPDCGSLQWKRSRGGVLDKMGNPSYFYVKLPKEREAQFLWDSPLFAVERRKLTLHLGLPAGLTDDEVADRYREMGFRGLFKVYLHCAQPPSELLLEKMRSLYAHQKLPPAITVISST
jgi:hypothetical protein